MAAMNGFDANGNFMFHNVNLVGLPATEFCCHNADKHQVANCTEYDTTCYNCGAKSKDGVYVRGQSMGCPRSYNHHVGSTCPVCGLKD